MNSPFERYGRLYLPEKRVHRALHLDTAPAPASVAPEFKKNEYTDLKTPVTSFVRIRRMSTKAERLAFVHKLAAAVNSGNESDLDAAFASDFKFIVPGTDGREAHGPPLPPGSEGKITYLLSSFLTSGPKTLITAFRSAFSDFKFYVLKSIAEDDGGENIVASRAEFTGHLISIILADSGVGVHTGEFLGVPPTGKSVVGRFVSFDRVVGDKIVSAEVLLDVAGLLVQLGALPPPKGF